MAQDPPAEFEPNRRQWLGYWSMIVQQTQNAFNDKMAQFILIPLGAAVGFSVESAAGLMIAVPFVLFAPIAGWMSDRYSKRDVMLGTAILQLMVLMWICGSVYLKNLPLALLGFFALAAQSAFFGPAKMGINKELVGSKHLGFATGVQQMTAMLAILVGQIVAGWWFDRRYTHFGGTPNMAWGAAMWPLLLLTICAVPTLLLAWVIPRVPAQGGEHFSAKVAVSHFVSLKDLWRDKGLRKASFGVAFFWGFAAFINLWSVKLAKFLTGGGEGFGTMSSEFMAAASLGMAGGFGFAAFLLRKRIELGWVPLAGILMTVFSLAMVLVPVGGSWFLITLAALAFSSALFLAPLNAWMQDRYPAAKRGELQSAANLQDCFAGIMAVIVIVSFEYGADALGVDPMNGFRYQMLFVTIACLLATWMIIQMLPAEFLRIIGVAIVRSLYRIRVSHPERLPGNGGVLMLPNHVTYVDAFLLSAASHRPIRFVMDEEFVKKRTIRIFTSIFDTMTIRRDHPLEAIREVIEVLQQSHAVCLFPEGQLTRTGGLNRLQRGFELIARKSGLPVIPMWVDGLWGSVFSYERNRFFRKLPQQWKLQVTVAYGQEIAQRDVTVDAVREAMLKASSQAIAHRFSAPQWSARMPQADHLAAQTFRSLDGAKRWRLWTNGYQIGMMNALQRRQSIAVLKHDRVFKELLGLFVGFAELSDAKVEMFDEFATGHGGVWVGGDLLREQIAAGVPTGPLEFYDFSEHSLQPLEIAQVHHYPCWADNGVVIAMSMPHPMDFPEDFEPQQGHKPQSWGKLLPGWHLVKHADGRWYAHGPAALEVGLNLPEDCSLDADGFLVVSA